MFHFCGNYQYPWNVAQWMKYEFVVILYSSWDVPRRILGGVTKVEQGKIRVGGERFLVITRALIETNVTQRSTSFHYQWYMFLFHWIIQSSIHLSCRRFVNSHPDLHITQRMSCKLLQYPVGLHLIRQIPCHFRPPITQVAIFMDAWLMCLSWHSTTITECRNVTSELSQVV